MRNFDCTIKIVLEDGAITPEYGRIGDAGLDLYTLEDCILKPGETRVIKTGIRIQLPIGYEATVRPRSGNSLKGVSCIALGKEKAGECKAYLKVILGTIDSNYTGDIGIIVYNQENYSVFVKRRTKLAQLVVSPVANANLMRVEKLNETNRGNNGFGSSDR